MGVCGDASCPLFMQISVNLCFFHLLCSFVLYSVAENLSLLAELKQKQEQQQQPVTHRCPVSSPFIIFLII